MTAKINGCQLEIDLDRGVVYVHGPKGATLVRISGVPTRVLKQGTLVNVTYDREPARLWGTAVVPSKKAEG